MHITVKKHGRQKLVRREKITLPGLKRQKQLVWNLACFSEKSFQPEVQVKEGTDRIIIDLKDKGSLPHNEAKINIFGTRAVSRFIRNCRSQIASARFCLCSRYTSHLSSLLLFYYYHKVNRCLARYSPRATTTNRPTNRALNKPAWPGPNWPKMPILGQIWSFLGK